MANEIEIGKGESKTIIFNITDLDSIFFATDRLLFAVKKILVVVSLCFHTSRRLVKSRQQ